MKKDSIIVIDFGSQYNHLIVRRIRQLGVYSELLSSETSLEALQEDHVKGIILSGGPMSVWDNNAKILKDKFWKHIDKPVLGICYGMQLMVKSLGGKVEKAVKGEYGEARLEIDIETNPLFKNIPSSIVWMSHQDHTISIPNEFEKIAYTENCEYSAIYAKDQQFYGIQFHPEVTHTEYGMDLIHNFVIGICKAEKHWKMEHYLDTLITDIQKNVAGEKVICGLSGGVDSSVTVALLQRAIGSEHIHCIYVDHGLMRLNETEEIHDFFNPILGNNFQILDASSRFFSALEGITDPEQKRKIIGKEFIECFTHETQKFKDAKFLAQGTLYTDIVESGSGGDSQTIKSHHNVGGLPEDLKFELIEPLKQLYKDEVRELGKVLGLHDSIVMRQPFPGPGLAIRVIGEVNRERVALVQHSDAILREEIHNNGLESDIWQYFTVLPNINSVGVRGDQRSYKHAIIIRAVCSVDGMSANAANIPYQILKNISRRITNEISEINRVLYDITDKPPSTIEYE